MSVLNLIDRYSSTIASGYTAGGTSLSVVSASGLPSGACYFFLIVKAESTNTEEVFLCTSISGTTLTVTGAQANTSASNHSSGATIIGSVLTTLAMQTVMANWNQSGTAASLPAASNAGKLYLPSDGVQLYRDSGSAFAPWGPIWPLTDPNTPSFSWVNQDGASVDSANGGTYLHYQPTGTGHACVARVKSAPSTPYTITIGLIPGIYVTNYQTCGIYLRDSSSGKLILFGHHYESGLSIDINKSDSPTVFNSHYAGFPCSGMWNTCPMWFRITDDGTNRTYYHSIDGYHWIQLGQTTNTDFMTANQVGWGIQNVSQSARATDMLLLSYKES